MIIRCERCSTLYDLDEKLLAPEGSSVQCAKCQAIFTAVPLRAGAAPAGPAAFPPPPAAPAPPAPSGPSRPPEPPRPARAGPNIYRRPPVPPAAPPLPRGRGRPGAPPRDAVSAMDARLRRLALWKLAAVPLAAALLILLAWGGWAVWKRRPDPETQRQRAEARALIAQDDAASLARALELLDAIQLGERASAGAEGERGLARALVAVAQADEVEPLADRLAAATAEKARLEREQPPGHEDAQRALAMEVTRLEVELAPKRQKLEALRSRAAEELKATAARPKGALEAARGLAVLAALESNAEEVVRTVGQLRDAGPDGWADLAELWLEVRRDAAARDRAIPRLGALAGAHPELIRARYILAKALQGANRREEAISAVNRLLAANPRHERAQRLRSQLTAPAPVQPAPVPPPPPPRPVLTPRPAPPPAATNVLVPVAEVPPQAAVNQPVLPVPAPAPAPEIVPPPPPVPVPAKPRPPEPRHIPDPTEG